MPKTPALPANLEVIATSDYVASQVAVQWSDEDHRFHFWTLDGTILGPLHRNPADLTKSGHRALDPDAKTWAPLIAAISAHVQAEGLIAKARTQVKADQEAALEAARQTRLAEIAQRVSNLADDLGGDSAASYIRSLLYLDDATLLRLAVAFR